MNVNVLKILQGTFLFTFSCDHDFSWLECFFFRNVWLLSAIQQLSDASNYSHHPDTDVFLASNLTFIFKYVSYSLSRAFSYPYRLINRYRRGIETCPQAKTSKSGREYVSSFFSDAFERRVWLSAESKILASTFGRFRLYGLMAFIFI